MLTLDQHHFRGTICLYLGRKQNPSRVLVDVEHCLSNTYEIIETELRHEE